MADARIATDAVLLTKSESGERGLLLTLLSAERGLLRAFKRTSSRSRQPNPDLFDEVSILLTKAKAGDLWFVDEYTVKRRRPQIGTHYRAFLYACRYSVVLSRNLFGNDDGEIWLQQLKKALDAWESGRHPEIVYFKALYLFAQHQGIPAKEDWVASLDRAGAEARAVLRQPLDQQTVAADKVEAWIAAFEGYLHRQHDVYFSTQTGSP